MIIKCCFCNDNLNTQGKVYFRGNLEDYPPLFCSRECLAASERIPKEVLTWGKMQAILNWFHQAPKIYKKTMTTDDEISLAQSLIGKTVQSEDNGWPFEVEKWNVVVCGEISSTYVEEYAKEYGFCVAVSGNGMTIPVTKAIVIKTIELNDGQAAKVFPDKIKIGNQTLTKEDIKKLWEAIQ